MKILAIETSSSVCSVAILEDEALIKEITIEDENTHSVKLMPIIENIFKDTNLKLEDIELFCCDKGPGSFTGIRIGVATIKAFIDVVNKEGIGISSLEALVYNVKEEGFICSLIDAKNSNVYAGVFKHIGGEYIQTNELIADNINNILDLVKNNGENIIFIGDGAINYKDKIIEKFGSNAIIKDNKLNAKNIGLAAFYKYKLNNTNEKNSLSPLYLKKSSAEIMLEEKKNGTKDL